jgi:hypothetical protein
MKPAPGEQRAYGMRFVDYYPYYQQAVCHMKLGDFSSASRLLSVELSFKQIQKNDAIY